MCSYRFLHCEARLGIPRHQSRKKTAADRCECQLDGACRFAAPRRLGQVKVRPAALYVLVIRAPPCNVDACMTDCVSTSVRMCDCLCLYIGVRGTSGSWWCEVAEAWPCMWPRLLSFLCVVYFSKWYVHTHKYE